VSHVDSVHSYPILYGIAQPDVLFFTKGKNMNLTYRELKRQLNAMSEEWLDANVSIHLSEMDEWFPVKRMLLVTKTDVLDEGHPYLEVEA
jgi:hypothetical protein